MAVGKPKEKGKEFQVFVNESSSSSTIPSFPPGFRFAPTEAELIMDYLQKKVMGQPIDYNPNPVMEIDLYGNEEPSQICRALGRAEHEELYVFTLVRSKSGAGGAHMSRRAGNGTWKGNHKAKPCFDHMGTHIGCRTTLNFFDNMSKRTSWIMHQYTLPHQQQGWTLCRIHNEDQAKKKRTQQHLPLLCDAPAKRPRTNDHTPSSEVEPTQTSNSDIGLVSVLLDDADVGSVLDFSHTTAAQNVYDDLASLLSLPALAADITEFTSSSSYPQQHLPSSSQPQGPDPFACNDWCSWLIDDDGALPF